MGVGGFGISAKKSNDNTLIVKCYVDGSKKKSLLTGVTLGQESKILTLGILQPFKPLKSSYSCYFFFNLKANWQSRWLLNADHGYSFVDS